MRAHYAPPSKKRAKLQYFFDIRKEIAIFFTFFYFYLRAWNIFCIFARYFEIKRENRKFKIYEKEHLFIDRTSCDGIFWM